jgi:hypothetical protein
MAAGSDSRLRSVSVSAPTLIAHDLGRLLGTLSVKADFGSAKELTLAFSLLLRAPQRARR